MEHPSEKAATEAKEKAFLQHQRKILDVGRPIIEVWAQLGDEDPIRDALEASLQLWGEAFHSVTKQRRENILKVTDPSFIQPLGDQGAFSVRESDRLFGPKFIARIVREAQEDRALRSLAQANRPTGQATNYRNGFRPQLAGRSSFRLSANRPTSMNRQRYVNDFKKNDLKINKLKTNNFKINNLKSNDLKSEEGSNEKLGGRLTGFFGIVGKINTRSLDIEYYRERGRIKL